MLRNFDFYIKSRWDIWNLYGEIRIESSQNERTSDFDGEK